MNGSGGHGVSHLASMPHEPALCEIIRHVYQRIYDERPGYGVVCHGASFMTAPMIRPDDRIIDFGCGRNGFCKAMVDRGHLAIGVDFAAPEADINCSIVDYPVHDGPKLYDWCTAFDVLEHIAEDQLRANLLHISLVGDKFAFSISSKSHIMQPYGELHLTQKPIEWWAALISEYASGGVQLWGRSLNNTNPYLWGVWK